MPRHGQAPATNIRNRYRINNKSRLKVIRGNVDTDPVVVDEDEEKNRLLQSVAGVDQEDANEHHLQAVLSAAALQHNLEQTTEKEKEEPAPTAYIPIPDSTGVANDYEHLYPSNRYKDPVGYIQSTYTVEDCTDATLAGGFAYLMDERDAEWLTKNNEEARGEGTSAQGAVSGARTSSRSTKAKGKEPDSVQPIVITEDQFELVMGLFEKVTHEKTEFLHHSIETGMAFPPFTDYQDTFSSPLTPSTFVSFTLPSWLPSSADLSQMARTIYPYWKERRLERSGHSIIPILNFDEGDTLNESYVCFRRRDVKIARKTRASQVLSSDKLARLEVEMNQALQLANLVLQREQLKRESAVYSQHVWEQRSQLMELRLKNPMLAEKGDEELLIDKERPSKKETTRVKISVKADASQSASRPQFIPPKERYESFRTTVEAHLQHIKEVDQHWEDVVDTGYIPPPASYTSRLFKYVTPPSTPRALSPELGEESTQGDGQRSRRAVRLRFGRGGRRFVDRRPPTDSHTSIAGRKRPRETEGDEEDEERDRRLRERWRFDSDDSPPYGPKGSDEQDRVLVDEFDAKHLQYTLDLTRDLDYRYMLNDPTIIRYTPDGKPTPYLPFRPSLPSAFPFRQPNAAQLPPAQTSERLVAVTPSTSSSRPGVIIPVSSSSPAQVSPARISLPQRTEVAATQLPIRPTTAVAPNASSSTSPASSNAPAPVTAIKPAPATASVPAPTPNPERPHPVQQTQPQPSSVARAAINIPYSTNTSSLSAVAVNGQAKETPSGEPMKVQSVPVANGTAQAQATVNGHNNTIPSTSTTAFHTAVTTPTTEFKLKLPPVRQSSSSSIKPPSSTARTGLPVQRPLSAMGGNAKVN
ncbi:Enhancer of polycomb-like protein 1 [Marasmius crinis-equi]|uniref:Enhancer of polycomb-like protein n=1 Tax=Marasmius crinis-equi TaxID=585013 RepID=A0ABR3FE81_9AGAR